MDLDVAGIGTCGSAALWEETTACRRVVTCVNTANYGARPDYASNRTVELPTRHLSGVDTFVLG